MRIATQRADAGALIAFECPGKLAMSAARETDPHIKLGVCGEHGGDPDSIRFFDAAGLDYVSCSPNRVPTARLAAAQAAVAAAR